MPLRDPLLPYVRPCLFPEEWPRAVREWWARNLRDSTPAAPAIDWGRSDVHTAARGAWLRAMYEKRGQLLTPALTCPSCGGPTYYDRQWRGLACLDALCNWQATIEALRLTPADLERIGVTR